MAALYEVVLRTIFAGQECVNRWNYVTSSTPTNPDGSIALLAGMGIIPEPGETIPAGNELLTKLQAVLSTGLLFGSVSARNVYEPFDFYEYVYPSDTNGDVTGESLSPFTSIGFKTNRVRQDIRRGTKRFAGIPESAVGTEGVLAGGVIPDVKDIGEAMSNVAQFTIGSVAYSFTPCVVKKEDYETPKGNTAYKYFATLEAQLENIAEPVIWTEYLDTRTQTSRQRGRGR